MIAERAASFITMKYQQGKKNPANNVPSFLGNRFGGGSDEGSGDDDDHRYNILINI